MNSTESNKAVTFGRIRGRIWRRGVFNKFNVAAFTLACAICNDVETRAAEPATNAPSAQASAATDTNTLMRLPEVVVQGRGDSLIGVADSATQGTVGAAQL